MPFSSPNCLESEPSANNGMKNIYCWFV